MNAIISSTSGRIGGILCQSHTSRLVNATREWLAGGMCLDEIRDVEALLPQRRSLALVVNNECNLSCTHCYLQIPRLSGKRLNTGDWRRVLDSAVEHGIEQFLLVGKEVLLGQTGPEVLAMLGEMRAQHSGLRTGIITNGTLLHKHSGLIENAALGHMDISMEGDADDHDAIRGTGAFAAVRSNVEWAARLLGERLFVALTLQKHNIRRLDKALAAFAQLGVQSVAVSPYEVLPYTDASLKLSAKDYRDFFAGLERLGKLPLPHEMMLQVDACAASPDMLLHFMESEWFDLDSMVANGTGFLYLHRRLENGLILSFRFQPWYLSFDLHSRIAADGAVICAADSYRVRAYPVNQLANFRDFGFDFGAASRVASVHPRLAYLDSRFESELAPRIRAAYRGHGFNPETFAMAGSADAAHPQLISAF